MSEDDKPLDRDDNPWSTLGKALPPIGSSPEERDRAIARYLRDIRPGLAAGDPALPKRPSVEAERAEAIARLEVLERTIWNEPVIISRGLAAKIPGWTESLEAAGKPKP
jgi:hypothetical protein